MSRYHPALVVLHWLLALMIIAALIAGNVILENTPNSDPEKLVSLRLHMSLGTAILVLMLIRLALRLFTPRPPHADTGNALLNATGTAMHWAYYVVVIAMSASGLGIAYLAGLPAIVFGGSGTPLPADFNDLVPRTAHGILGTVLGLMILAHIAAGFWHHYRLKDNIFARMRFGRRG